MRIENIGNYFKKFLCIAMVAGLFGSPAVRATPGDATITHKLGSIANSLKRIKKALIFTLNLPECEEGNV
jgi:hypothetical protein